MGRRFLSAAVFFALLLFAGLWSGLLFIPLVPWLENTASQAASVPVSIGRLQLSGSGAAVMKDVSVGPKTLPWLTVSEIRMSPQWRDLLKRKIALKRVALIEPTLNWGELTGIPRLARGHRRQSAEQNFPGLVDGNDRPTEIFRLKVPIPSTTELGEKGLAGLGLIKRIDIVRGRFIFPKTPWVGPIDLQCSLKNRQVRLERLAVKMGNGALTGNGQVDFDSGHFEFQSDIRDFPLDRVVRGFVSFPADREIRYTGHGKAQGTFSQWEMQTEGHLVQGIANAGSKTQIFFNGTFDGPQGKFQTHLEGPSLKATANVSLDKKRQWVDGQFAIAVPSLAGLGLWPAAEGARGSGTLRGNVKGPWHSPDFSAQAEGNSLGYGPISVDHFTARGDRRGAKKNPLALDFSVSSLLWSPAQGTPRTLSSAHITWSGQLNQGVLGAHIRLNDISFESHGPAQRDKNGFQWEWKKFIATPSNAPPWRAASGTLLTVQLPDTFEIKNLQFGEIESSLTLRRFLWEKGALEMDLAAHLFPLHVSPFQGILSAQIQLKGPLENPQGTFDLRLSSASVKDSPLAQIRTNGTVENALVTLNNLQIAVSSFPLVQGHGVIPWGWILQENPEHEADVTIQAGPLDPAGLFQTFPLVEIQPGGSVQLEGRLQGRRTTMKARGRLLARLPGLKIPSWGIDAQDAQVNADLLNEHYRIRETGVKLGKGGLRLSGEGDWPALRLDIQGDQLALNARRFLKIKTDLRIALDGTWTEPVLSGEVSPTEATYEAKPKKKGPPEQEKPPPLLPFWDRLQMEIQTDWENNVWYRDGLTKIETQADLRASKERGQRNIRLNGPMTLLRGTYDAYGRDFSLKSGEITFTSSEEIDPLLNIRAEHKTPHALIELDISGTGKKPILHFRSTPPMTEPDILALLAIGKVPGQTASSPSEPGQSSGAMDLAADVVSDYLTQGVRSSGMNLLDLDVIRVSPADKGSEWTVGRYWGSKLFLSYSYNPEISASQILKAEYTFLPRWTLVGQTGSSSDDYLDVIFRWPIRDRKKKIPTPDPPAVSPP